MGTARARTHFELNEMNTTPFRVRLSAFLTLLALAACQPESQTVIPAENATDENSAPVELIPSFPVDRYRGRGVDDWINDIETGDKFKKFRAIVALGEMERDAQMAVPVIEKVLDDPESEQGLQTKALAALGRIGGRRACAALGPFMTGEDEILGVLASDAFGRMGSSAVDAILPYLNSPDARVRLRGTRALRGVLHTDGKMTRMEAAVVPLAHALADENLDVQGSALEVLSELGSRATAATPVIIERLKMETRNESKKILMVMIGGFGSGAVEAVDVLRENMADEDEQVQLFAALSLARVGQVDEGVGSLIEFLKSSEFQVRLAAADALRRIGPPAQAAIEPLKQARKNAQDTMHIMIEQALKAIREE